MPWVVILIILSLFELCELDNSDENFFFFFFIPFVYTLIISFAWNDVIYDMFWLFFDKNQTTCKCALYHFMNVFFYFILFLPLDVLYVFTIKYIVSSTYKLDVWYDTQVENEDWK